MTLTKNYLGVPKSSGGGTLFSYKTVEEIFFFYRMIEKTKLYLSVLFDPYSTGIIIVKFR